jgi:hypothetical protein
MKISQFTAVEFRLCNIQKFTYSLILIYGIKACINKIKNDMSSFNGTKKGRLNANISLYLAIKYTTEAYICVNYNFLQNSINICFNIDFFPLFKYAGCSNVLLQPKNTLKHEIQIDNWDIVTLCFITPIKEVCLN